MNPMSPEKKSPSPIAMELETVSAQRSVLVVTKSEGARKSKRSGNTKRRAEKYQTPTRTPRGKQKPGRPLGSRNRRELGGGPRILSRKRRKTVRLSRYKQYHDVEDIVYANRSQEKDGKWYRGMVVDYEFVCNGTFGDVRTYTIHFDDGVDTVGIHEFFVDTAEDFEWMNENNADNLKGVTQVTSNGSADRYMRERGYYEVELGRDQVYRSLVPAMRAYDGLLVQLRGSKVTPRELNLPGEWKFDGFSVPQRLDVVTLRLRKSQKVPHRAIRDDDDSQVTMTDVSSVDSSRENSADRMRPTPSNERDDASCPVNTSGLSRELMELAKACATNAAQQYHASTNGDWNSLKTPSVDWTTVYEQASQTLRSYMDSKATEAGFPETEDKKSRLVPKNIMKGYDEYFIFLFNQLLKAKNKQESVVENSSGGGDCPVDLSLFSDELHELAYLLSFYDPSKKCNQYNSYWPEVLSKASKRLRRAMDSVEGFHESRRKRLLLVPPKLLSTFAEYHRYLYNERCAGRLEEKKFSQDDDQTVTADEKDADGKGKNTVVVEEDKTVDKTKRHGSKADATTPRDDECPVDLAGLSIELRELAEILSERHPHQKGGGSLWRKARDVGSPRLNRYLDSLDGFDVATKKFAVAVPSALREKFMAYRIHLYEKRISAEDDTEDESDCPIDKTKFTDFPELLEIAKLAKSFPYSKGTPVRNLWRHVHTRASSKLRTFLESRASPEGFLKMRSKQQRLVPAELMDDFVLYRRHLHKKYCEKSAKKGKTLGIKKGEGEADYDAAKMQSDTKRDEREGEDEKDRKSVDRPKGDGGETGEKKAEDTLKGDGDEADEVNGDGGTDQEMKGNDEAPQSEADNQMDNEEEVVAEDGEEHREEEETQDGENVTDDDSMNLENDEKCPDTSRLSPELIELAKLLSRRDPSVVYNKENSIWPLVFKKASRRLRRHMDSVENFSTAKCKENALVPAHLRTQYVAYRTYLQSKRYGYISSDKVQRKRGRESAKPKLRSSEVASAPGGGGSNSVSDEESASTSTGGCPIDTSELTPELLEIAELCSLRDPQVCGSNKRTFWTDVYNMASPRVQKYMKRVKGFATSHKKRDLLIPASCRETYLAYLNYLVKKRKMEFSNDSKARSKKKSLAKPKKTPTIAEPKRKRTRPLEEVDEASPDQQKRARPKVLESQPVRKRCRTEGRPNGSRAVDRASNKGPQTPVKGWHLKYERRSRAFEDSADHRWRSFSRLVRRQWNEVSGMDQEKLARDWESFQESHRNTWQDFLNGEAEEVLYDCELALRSAQRNLSFDESTDTNSQLDRYMKMVDRYMDRRKHRLESTLDWLHAQIEWFLGRHRSVQLVQWNDFWEEVNEHADEFRCLGRVALEKHLDECEKAIIQS